MANAITAKSLLEDKAWGKVALGLLRSNSDPIMESCQENGVVIGIGPYPAHTVQLLLSVGNLTDNEITGFFKAHGLDAKADRKTSHVVIEIAKDHDKLKTANNLYLALDKLRSMVRGPMIYKDKSYDVFLGFRGNDTAQEWSKANADNIAFIIRQFRDFGIEMKQAGEITFKSGSHAPTQQDSKQYYDEAYVRFAPVDQQNRLALEKLETRVSTLQAMLEGRVH